MFAAPNGTRSIPFPPQDGYLRRHPTSIAFSRVGYFGLNQKTKKTKNQRFPNLVASAGRAWERLGRPGGAWEGLASLGRAGLGSLGRPGEAWGGWGSLGRPGKALRSLGSFPPSECPFRPGSFSSLSASFLRSVLEYSFSPKERPFRPGSLSSLSASFLRSVFKKSFSSLRVSFSTWVVFLPQRIIFEKCI